MKMIFSLLLVTFAFNSANAVTIARYQFADFNMSLSDFKVVEVVLEDNSTATVRTYASDNRQVLMVKSRKLNKKLFSNLREKVLALVQAEIEERHNSIVCMIAVHPGQRYDNLYINREHNSSTGQFADARLTLVDGPHGCWVSHYVGLKQEWQHEKAHILKENLKLFALHFLN